MGALKVNLTSLESPFAALELPVQFSYRAPSPVKRFAEVPTHGGLRIHVAPAVVEADSLIGWSIEAGSRAEWTAIRDYYLSEGKNSITFDGYWGDIFVIKFLVLDEAEVRGINFNMSGSFRIVSVTNWGTAS